MIRNFTDAFKAAGYDLASPRSQWSAIKSDGRSVVVTIWSDEIDKTTDPWQVDLRNHSRLDVWKSKPGNGMRKKHIRHALQHCGGRVDLILCKAIDPKADTRKVEWARPWAERVGIIHSDEFDEVTGEFRMLLLDRKSLT